MDTSEQLTALEVPETPPEPQQGLRIPTVRLKQIVVPGPDGTFITKYVLTNRQQRRAEEKAKRKPNDSNKEKKARKSKSR